MARPLRMEFAGALWHVTSRGNERRTIVRDDKDRARFLAIVGKVVEETSWRLHAYVLMDNHYHLLLETPEPNLSAGMRQLNGLYAQGFNRRHSRVGHLFQGRFKGILVEREAHLLELSRYIVLNPVRGSISPAAVAYRWSSYRATAGLELAPKWLESQWLLRSFGGTRAAAHRRYREFVAEGEGRPSPWKGLVRQVFLGTEEFAGSVVQDVAPVREVPRAQRLAPRPGIDELLASVAEECGVPASAIRTGRGGSERMLVAYLGRRECGLRLRPIAAVLSVDIGHVSHLAAAGDVRAADDPSFARTADAVRKRLAVERPALLARGTASAPRPLGPIGAANPNA